MPESTTSPAPAPKPVPGTPKPVPNPAEAKPGSMPPIDQLKDRPLGRVLIKMGRLTREQVHQALAVQAQQKARHLNTPIGQVLVDLGMISQKDLNFALAAQRGFEVVDIEGRDLPPDLVKQIPSQMASVYRVVPIAFEEKTKTLTIALDSPDNFRVRRPILIRTRPRGRSLS